MCDSQFNRLHPYYIHVISAQVAQIINSTDPKFQLKYQVPQEQNGANDCGLFAMARAVAWAENVSMVGDAFDQHLMCKHLLACLEANCITPFLIVPVRSKNVIVHDIEVLLFCVCRLPQIPPNEFFAKYVDYDSMIQCDKCLNWYHQFCMAGTLNDEQSFHCNACLCK